jgi:hypothetical protein
MEKEKRKYSSRIHQRLYGLLLVWLVVTFLAAFYPLIWLAPPYLHLTPYVYLGAALGWLPFAFRHIRRHGWRWLTILLIVGCLVASIYTTHVINRTTQTHSCSSDQNGILMEYGCYDGWVCPSFVFTSIGNLPVGVLTYWRGGCIAALF